MDLKNTPISNIHKELGAKMAPFGGFLMPIQYEGIIAEHNWTRSACSLFDVCHMGEFIIQGDYLRSGLDKIVTVNLREMAIQSCKYGFMLNSSGGVIDDLIVYRIEQEEWMIVVNAATVEKDEENIKKNLGWDSHFKNISSNIAKLDLQGPLSLDVLKNLSGETITKLCYYTFDDFTIEGEKYLISRTGYTGELGYEIYATASHAENLWEIFLGDKRVKPAGLGARDTLRLEMGYSLYGHELNEEITPLEASLMRFVEMDKDFIGRDALIKQQKRGPSKKLVALIATGRRSPREDYKVFLGDREIGYITSGSPSPSLGSGIALGYVSSEYSKTGLEVLIKSDNIQIEAKVVKKPIYTKGMLSEEVFHGSN
ncbi:MAG: glycine cleavage system aminomethyltransferase GcvT [Candidatus Kaelpia aquatica]|nr:glycine cleavage system aminomethyltransferase GcvT [Candidatus Kaelpia aquatica]